MKEFFDQLRNEAERRQLPQPAELRARGDRRAARRGAAGAFSLAVVMAGGFIAARPLFHEPSNTAKGVISTAPQTDVPEIAVPNVVGLSRNEAIAVLEQQGFKVHVMVASPPPSGSPEAGKVRQQDPVWAKRIPSETTITLWVDPPEPTGPVCADKYPKALLSVTLFVKTEVEICYADNDPLTTTEPLPMPCPATPLASEALVEDRRGFYGTFTEEIPGSGPAPTILDQTITRYKGTGAKDYLAELTRDVGRCAPVNRGGLRLTYSMATQSPQEKLGEQSILINLEDHSKVKPEGGYPQTTNFLIYVVRTGLNVIVVYDKGWERNPSKRETIIDTAREILRRLTASPSPAR